MTKRKDPVLLVSLPLFALVAIWVLMIFKKDAEPVLLMTDALFFLLIGFALLGLKRIFKRESFHIPLDQIRRRPLAMSSLLILCIYILIAFTDSLHLRLPVETENKALRGQTLSLFDIATQSFWLEGEKTYSAPLAIKLYVKENLQKEDGTTYRDYPALEHAGSHLSNPEAQHLGDIRSLTLKSFGLSMLASALILLLLSFIARRSEKDSVTEACGKILKGSYTTPWRSIWLTASLIAAFFILCLVFAGQYHLFGTDKVGQSVLYQSLKSIRTGLIIGTLTTLVMLPFAILMGLCAGYFRGWVDDLIQYLYTTLSSIPGVLLIAAAVLLLQVYMSNHEADFDAITRSDLRLLFLCMILGLTSWTSLCRLLRAETLKVRELNYVVAAKSMGVSNLPILLRHILPNVMHIVLIVIALDFSGLVLAEAVLSYVGVGVDPTMNSWGNMINQARMEMARDPLVWWSLTAAFVFMFILVLAANIFADAVRDAFDPKLRERT